MPKINVYLPEDLAAAVREAGLSVSPICQQALAEAVRVVGTARDAVEALRDPDADLQQHVRMTTRLLAQMTPRLRHALARARELAGPAGLVGTQQLLVGVIDEPGNLGVQVLQLLDVDVARLRDAAVQGANPPEHQTPARRSRTQKTRSTDDWADQQRDEQLLDGLSTTAREAIAAAVEAAIDLGHNFLGCEHLLLGLADQNDSGAGELLSDLGIKRESIRKTITAALAGVAGGHANARQLLPPTTANHLEDLGRRLDELEERLRAGGL